ncbi:hypothetical protein M197_gp11 [Haloarcula hispanica tailed virus 2]|uniref:Uncharacterized protein n=1 Tax=Haloarcula hispanica tailed virus 2 TaxID=1273751 RepID=R4TKH8_9CAUD|nr:hypothetical protein M197_gp11 [Haloarcula hispanica tailed virus 2]AGM11177.1 hypothetical protein HHTV2_11 [Haloarcula hispanica tailed virus 2]
MKPTDEQAFDVPTDDRRAIRSALDHARGFLLVGGLRDEEAQAERVLETLNETPETEPVTLREVDAARTVASLVAYREHLLDEGEVPAAAEAEEAIRTLAEQNAALAAMTEDPR